MWLAGANNDLGLGYGHWLIAGFGIAAGLMVLAVGKLQAALKIEADRPERETIVPEKGTAS